MRTILLTGATGFLGSHLLHELLSDDQNKLIITKFHDIHMNRLSDVESQLTVIDLELSDWVQRLSDNKIDIIIHLATNYGRSKEDLDAIMEANFHFPVKLLDFAINNNVKYFINTDTSLPKEINNYALSKKRFLEELKSRQDRIKVVNMVLEHFFGPNDGKFVSNMMALLINKVDKIDLSTGIQKRDFLYYNDIINAYKVVLDSLDSFDKKFMEFEVGSGVNYSIREVMELMKKISGNRNTVLNWGAVPQRDNELMESNVAMDGLKNLGWRPSCSLEGGIDLMFKKMNAKDVY